MAPNFRKTVLAFLALVVLAAPAYAKTKVTILPPSTETKSVVIKKGNQTLIINTTPDAAERIRKMIKNSDRVIIRTPYSYTYYPEEYYPYYVNKGPAYSVGRALGTKFSD